jgi:hypothetical protein
LVTFQFNDNELTFIIDGQEIDVLNLPPNDEKGWINNLNLLLDPVFKMLFEIGSTGFYLDWLNILAYKPTPD